MDFPGFWEESLRIPPKNTPKFFFALTRDQKPIKTPPNFFFALTRDPIPSVFAGIFAPAPRDVLCFFFAPPARIHVLCFFFAVLARIDVLCFFFARFRGISGN